MVYKWVAHCLFPWAEESCLFQAYDFPPQEEPTSADRLKQGHEGSNGTFWWRISIEKCPSFNTLIGPVNVLAAVAQQLTFSLSPVTFHSSLISKLISKIMPHKLPASKATSHIFFPSGTGDSTWTKREKGILWEFEVLSYLSVNYVLNIAADQKKKEKR